MLKIMYLMIMACIMIFLLNFIAKKLLLTEKKVHLRQKIRSHHFFDLPSISWQYLYIFIFYRHNP